MGEKYDRRVVVKRVYVVVEGQTEHSPAPPAARPREAGVFLHRTTDYSQRRTNSRQNADQGLNDHFPNRFLVHSSFVF